MDRHKKYREEQKEKRRVRVSAYVPEEDRERALKYLERLRKTAEAHEKAVKRWQHG